MKIGIAEVLYPEGHKELDINTINILSGIGDTYYFSYGGFLKLDRLCDNVKVINVNVQFNPQHIAKIITFSRIINLLLIRKAIKKHRLKIDTLILLSFDNSLTKVISRLFPEIRVIVIHHDDVDKISEALSERDKRYYNLIHHIVYEEYIRDGLINKTNCDESVVSVVPHPLVFDYRSGIQNKAKKTILGIGWSNDEKIITELIMKCKSIKHKLPYQIIVRSKCQKYQDDNLEVITGFLSKDRYDELIRSADIQVILYPDTFKYRYSATFQTALLQGCYVLINDVYIGRELNKMFPDSTYILSGIEELLTLDDEFLKRTPSKEDIQTVLNYHSDENIRNCFEEILC